MFTLKADSNPATQALLKKLEESAINSQWIYFLLLFLQMFICCWSILFCYAVILVFPTFNDVCKKDLNKFVAKIFVLINICKLYYISKLFKLGVEI